MDPKDKEAADLAAEEAAERAKAEEEAKAKAEVEAKADKDEPKIDYKAELAKEQEARKKAEEALAARSFKEREEKRKRDPEGEEGQGGEDKPITGKDLEALENRLFRKAQDELLGSRIKEVAGGLSSGDESLAALIIETHKNRSFPPNLSIEQQLEESFAIIHGRQMAAKAAELARALKSKDSAYRSSGTEHRKGMIAEEPELSSVEKTALKDAGLTWDPNRNAYKKPLAGGKKSYFFDPKTKKRWTE